MKIKMYNCGFGDCFRITTTSERDLFVDFGGDKRQAIDDVGKDSAFLLTHFHEDHFKNAMNIGARDNKFREVYIPDVWDAQTCTDVVALLLMDSKINSKMSVMDFLLKVCDVNSGSIHFVRRGSRIEKDFIALWPCRDYLVARAKAIMTEVVRDVMLCAEVRRELPFDMGEVRAIASQLIQSVSHYVERPQAEAFWEELKSLKCEYDRLKVALPKNKMVGYQLSNFGNLISIVFQNVRSEERNVLFLGDFGKSKGAWELMEDDSSVKMHKTYSDIKIPHHGTPAYYHSFVKYFSQNEYQPTTIYIPNGCHRRKNWRIYERYSKDVNSVPRTISQCTNNDTCNAATPNCQCRWPRIVCFQGEAL